VRKPCGQVATSARDFEAYVATPPECWIGAKCQKASTKRSHPALQEKTSRANDDWKRLSKRWLRLERGGGLTSGACTSRSFWPLSARWRGTRLNFCRPISFPRCSDSESQLPHAPNCISTRKIPRMSFMSFRALTKLGCGLLFLLVGGQQFG